jgi:hypothetical protein
VLKGDNNTWADSFRPSEDEIIGDMAALVPGLGRPLGAVRTPWGVSAVVSMAALGVIGGRRRNRHAGANHASRARKDAPATRARDERGSASPRRPARIRGHVRAVLAGLAALALVFGVILFILPPTTPQERDLVYQHMGAFSYGGKVSEAGVPVYGRSNIQTGDPVYLGLTDRIRITFDYTFDASAPLAASGTVGMVAELSDVNGWRRSMELAAPISFDGADASVTGELDLQSLSATTAELERLTGVQRDHYTVTVRPEVSFEGTLADLPLYERFAPELRFMLDPLQLQLEPAGAAPPGVEELVDPLHPVSGNLLKTEVDVPRSFSVFGTELRLADLRVVAAAMLGIAVAGLLLIELGRARSARRGEAAFIESRYGQWLVPVQQGGGAPSGRAVQVESFDSLVRLATHYGHVVLHEESEGSHTYTVEENGVTYRYVVQNGTRSS